MKKITLLLALLVSSLTIAQTTCATAVAVNTTGTNTVTAYGTEVPVTCSGNGNANGSVWYTYTATGNGVLNLSSDIASNNNIDTRVNIYTGTCAALTCAGGGDDVSYPANLTTNINVDVSAGVTYYIAWDNRWSSTVPFDFTASFTAVTGPPDAVTTPSPVDMATGVVIDTADNNMDGTADNAVALSWVPATTGSPATEYDILYGTDPTALNNLTAAATFTSTSVNITGNQFATTYYWQIVAINGSGSSTNNPIWSFTTETPSGTPPGNATTPTPADGATMVTIDPTDTNGDGTPDNAVAISWTAPTSTPAPTAYTIRLGTDPTNLNELTTTFAATAARFINQTGNTTYYWQIVPTTNGVEAVNQPIWSYTTEATASVEDNIQVNFTVSPNPTSQFLNLDGNVDAQSAVIYNGLGQIVLNKFEIVNNRVDVSKLQTGLYFIAIESENGAKSLRFIKE